MNGRDDTNTFLPLDSRIGGQNRDSPTVGQYLTRDQTRYIYKKVETEEIINTNMIQEIEQEKQLGKIDDTSSETNPYRELIVNNAEKNRSTNDTDGTVVYFKQHSELCTTQQI